MTSSFYGQKGNVDPLGVGQTEQRNARQETALSGCATIDTLPEDTIGPLGSLRVPDLLRLHADVLDELRRRRVVRSANGPAGDYGEILFSRAFGWQLQANATAGYDGVDDSGRRYQIKCRRVTPRNPSRQLSFIRDLPDRPFDILAGVILDQNYLVTRAALVPFEVVMQKATFSPHVKAWRLILRDSIWTLPGVEDVTDVLKAKAEKL